MIWKSNQSILKFRNYFMGSEHSLNGLAMMAVFLDDSKVNNFFCKKYSNLYRGIKKMLKKVAAKIDRSVRTGDPRFLGPFHELRLLLLDCRANERRYWWRPGKLYTSAPIRKFRDKI